MRWITLVGTAAGVAYSQALPGHHEPYDAIIQASIFGAAWVIGTLNRHRLAALAAASSRAARSRGLARRRRRQTPPPPSGLGSPASCTTWWRTT